MPKVSLIAYEAQYNLWEYRNHLENGLQPRTVLIPWHFTSLDCLFIRFNGETTDHSSPSQREQELEAITYADENGNDPTTKRFARNVGEMRKASNSPQWDKILEIRKKLRQYNDCLLQQARVSKLDRADVFDSRSLRYWLQHEEGGKGFLEGCERRAYDELEDPDLISLSNRSPNDKFARWLELSLVPRLPVIFKKILVEPVVGLESMYMWRTKFGILRRIARALVVVLSAVLPFTAIVALYFIENLRHRIAMIAVFSGVFALVLTIFTTARPVEIFAATAAFTSVQVVFVGGTSIEGGQFWLSGSVTTKINPTSQRTSSDGIFVMGAIAGLVIKSKDMEATSFNKCEVDFFARGMRDFEAGSVYPDDDPTDDPDLHPTGPVAHGSAA
ncbi:hypothetical protein B0T12DRAFT_490380 [Alternaria alternata]|nr:hypothetical protein B0T12DRAFT_490380 [Alternaria alternata]